MALGWATLLNALTLAWFQKLEQVDYFPAKKTALWIPVIVSKHLQLAAMGLLKMVNRAMEEILEAFRQNAAHILPHSLQEQLAALDAKQALQTAGQFQKPPHAAIMPLTQMKSAMAPT